LGKITAKSTLRYFLLPGIVPWARDVLFSGFRVLAYYVALIFAGLRLLPNQHRFLHVNNIGSYGVIAVVREAYKNLKFEWIRIDQVVVFSAVTIGIILAFLYIISLIMYVTVGPVFAQSITGIFSNPNPREDVAFMMMDRTFGIPGIFDTKIITEATTQMPTAFQRGMLSLFSFFSYGMLVVAVIILLYYIVEIVVETSVTGTPFGRRFENAFVPIRIVAAIGMLIPLSYGLNSAQWMTLYIAKFGSNMASNAWAIYNSKVDNPMGLENAELIAKPTPPDASGLMKDLFLIRACIEASRKTQSYEAYLKYEQANQGSISNPGNGEIVAIGVTQPPKIFMLPSEDVVPGGQAFDLLSKQFRRSTNSYDTPGRVWPEEYGGKISEVYQEALRLSGGKDIRLVVGVYDKKYKENNQYPGGVIPLCGEIVIPISGSLPDSSGNIVQLPQNDFVRERYLAAVLKILVSIEDGDTNPDLIKEKEIHQDFVIGFDRYLVLNTNFRNAWDALFKGGAECKYDIGDSTGDGNLDQIDNYVFDNSQPNVDVSVFGKCDEPLPAKFYKKQLDVYNPSFANSAIYGYDFLTGQGQEYLDSQCGRARGYEASCNRMGAQNAIDTCKKNIQDKCDLANKYRSSMKGSIYYKDLGLPNPLAMADRERITLLRYGWGGAGFWFRYVAEMNGELINTVNGLPAVTKYPLIFEKIQEQRRLQDSELNLSGCERFNPQSISDGVVNVDGSFGRDLAGIYYQICNALIVNESLRPTDMPISSTGNFLTRLMDMLFGADSIFNFRENSAVHPLAQLSALGKALIDRTMLNFFSATSSSFIGGVISAFGSVMGATPGGEAMGALASAGGGAAKAVSGIFMTFAMITLTAGVLLYYVLPMLPFMHFFFAVGRWVKTIFEALVGVPLWALAHMRMEGEGLPSKASSAGYFLLLEIFLRPILTVFSLLGAMGAFAASAYILNITWGLITNNLVGYDPVTQASSDIVSMAYYRPRVDQFFFTIMYIIMVYMIATGSFKMIDLIPDGIMKWLSDTKTFGASDNADDYVDQTSSWIAMPSVMYGNQIGGKVVDLAYEVPSGLGETAAGLMRMGQPAQGADDSGVPGPATPGGVNAPTEPGGQGNAPPPSRPQDRPAANADGAGAANAGGNTGGGEATGDTGAPAEPATGGEAAAAPQQPAATKPPAQPSGIERYLPDWLKSILGIGDTGGGTGGGTPPSGGGRPS
jgi:hypothetical protein